MCIEILTDYKKYLEEINVKDNRVLLKEDWEIEFNLASIKDNIEPESFSEDFMLP